MTYLFIYHNGSDNLIGTYLYMIQKIKIKYLDKNYAVPVPFWDSSIQ